jgi:diketogulonate reductase-like aldo/keto reductase
MAGLNETQEWVNLRNGIRMPLLGLGVYGMQGRKAEYAIRQALDIGYRLIDTASMYGNEEEVGRALRGSLLSREQVFITSKVNNADQGFAQSLAAYEDSLRRLRTDYLDLYLIHWPVREKRKDTWRALEKMYGQGQVRAIGVANCLVPLLEEIKSYGGPEIPMVNQVEFSPFLYLSDLLDYCRKKMIQLQAYAPLIRGKKNRHPRLLEISAAYGKTVSQLILRWNIQLGVSAIPKSADPDRLRENFQIFDFQIFPGDMEEISGMNEDLRLVGNPADFI